MKENIKRESREVKKKITENPEYTAFGLGRYQVFESLRCIDIAKKELQTGLMWLGRSSSTTR